MNREILRAGFEVRSMHLASTLYYAERYIVMTVSIPVQERDATCRIVASAEFDVLVFKSY